MQVFGERYDYGTGAAAITSDQNGNLTDFSYTPSGAGVDRVSQVSFPNGGHTYYTYPNVNTVVTQQDQSSSGDALLKSQQLLDGFGRPKESDTFESSSGYIASTTAYDALGRVSATTNPSRSGDGLNYGTVYSYDSLGRQTAVTTADLAVASTSYSGNSTTVMDQVGRQRKYTSDGLGRVVSVTEDPTGLNYSTSYTFDALGDLLSVSQNQVCPGTAPTGGAHPAQGCRYFSYDPLSRLISSVQPESGTFSYSYL